ncbi:MAG: hypothetical protein GY953_44555 [bacterium]|nr:hypothetical protein [bacterium]
MTRDILKFAGVGIGIIIVVVAIILFMNRGAHVVLEGSVQKTRVLGVDDRSALVVVDFRFVNPSDHPFIVRHATVILEDREGNHHEGSYVDESSARRVFEYYPLLGPKYNETLKVRDRVESRESLDRMICARFEVPDSTVETRQRLIIRVEDVDGAISEIVDESSGERL